MFSPRKLSFSNFLAKHLLVLLLASGLAFADDTQDSDSNHFAPVISSKKSLNNHETRVQKLKAALDSGQDRIMDQVVWHVDPNKPIDRVEVHIGEQKLYAFQNDKVVGISPVSTARAGYVTPLGSYKISDMKETYFSSLYGEFEDDKGNIVDYNATLGQTPPPGAHYVPSPMPFFMRLTDEGMGMHAGYLPGYPASHGCIRLPAPVAQNLFKQVSIGTSVSVMQ